ncbi:MAG: M48 family metallopeptidase [Acidimicrobiia bacterium]|nr:M48 family metallopeptidase [Acidimicrobiia bacterium]
MELTTAIRWLAGGLIAARWMASMWLFLLNRRHVVAHANAIPTAFAGIIDESTYGRSVSYTLARNRFSQIAETYTSLVLLAVLFSGVLPWGYELALRRTGTTSWAMALFLISVGLGMGLSSLPFGWIARFRLEDRFGFNTSTQRTWWLDLVKGALLAIALGYPLLVAILRIVEWSGASWWLWVWATIMALQLTITVLAPVLILPLFNKLTPLPEGSLRNRLTALAAETHFEARSIQVMDGSRRSRHSNAFFTGFGRLRKIVLFDTLIEQMEETELEAVLAHEIGHSKRRHVPKLLVGSAAGSLAGLWVMARLGTEPAFVEAFGFSSPASTTGFTGPGVAPVLLLFGLLSGALTFWLNPLVHWTSRRYEYEADSFAREVMGDSQPMIGALRKLNEKNLSNLTPHPIYSKFHYSHPTLVEREAALRAP